jgi:hypothetical protein
MWPCPKTAEQMVALLTLETGELTFEFAINEDRAKAWPETCNSSLIWCSRAVGPIDQAPEI